MNAVNDQIVFENVSKFYGEVLGVNRISLTIPPGITTLVGPNGSGKTTLMNLMTGLVQPSSGRLSVRGLEPGDANEFFRNVGYCTQFDSFPRGITAWQFLLDSLLLYGMSEMEAHRLAREALERVELGNAAFRKIAGYSKGMRQKVRLAQAIAHHPRVLILDEPLNGLDPMARAESLALFEELGRNGMHLIISSHILDEVDSISDRVVLITGGYLVAEGNIHQVRREVQDKPMQVLVLDEPLNGLDPMARAESLTLFEDLGRHGMHLIISSHILDEVDSISDRVVLITGGYLVAEGNIHQVRQEVRDKPMQILVRCDHPELLASRMFSVNHCVEARMHADGKGVFLRTGEINQFYSLLNGIAVEGLVKIDTVAPADDDANAIYQYLIGTDGSAS